MEKKMEYFKNEKTIYFAKIKPNAIIFNKEDENAGYDIFSCFDEDYILIEPHQTSLVPTGIAWASSPEYYLQIEERSSTGSKGIKKSAGVVDSGYRGEIKVAITNANNYPLVILNPQESEAQFAEKYANLYQQLTQKYGQILFYSGKKAIAQGIIHRVEKMDCREISIDELLQISSNRGDRGWGSTNKA